MFVEFENVQVACKLKVFRGVALKKIKLIKEKQIVGQIARLAKSLVIAKKKKKRKNKI